MLELRPDLFRRAVYVTCSAPPAGRSTLEHDRHAASTARTRDEVGWPVGSGDDSMAERFHADVLQRHERRPRPPPSWPSSARTCGRLLTDSHRDWRYDHLGADPGELSCVCLRDLILPVAWQELFAEPLSRPGRMRRASTPATR